MMNILGIFLIGAVLEASVIFGAAGGAFAATGGASAATGAPSASTGTLNLTIYHTNDIHGWIFARPASEAHAVNPKDVGRLIGGAPALANFLKQDAAGPHLLLDAGDWFQGTPEGNGTKGETSAEIFNALGYDAVEIGNHDFDYGQEQIEHLASMMKMPVLGANIYRENNDRNPKYIKPWTIKNVGGVRVGIFGLLTTNMKNLSRPEYYKGLKFRREIDEARDAVKTLRKKGATVIIAVTHIGFQEVTMSSFEDDRMLAKEVGGIDLIVGGHTHTFLTEPVRDPAHGTLIVQDGTALSRVGKVVFEIDPRTQKVISSKGELIRLWVDQYGQDPQILKIIEKYSGQVSRFYDVVIATSAVFMRRNRDAESLLGDWMADCEREAGGADVGIQNGGGIRSDIAAGPVSYRDVFDIMPFDNRLTTMTLNGQLLYDVLDHGVDRNKSMIQVSGVTFEYNRDSEAGHRVRDIKVNGKPFDPSVNYTIATLDFVASGGDGYSSFSHGDHICNNQALIRDILRDCAIRHSPIQLPVSPRMMLEGGGPTKP